MRGVRRLHPCGCHLLHRPVIHAENLLVCVRQKRPSRCHAGSQGGIADRVCRFHVWHLLPVLCWVQSESMLRSDGTKLGLNCLPVACLNCSCPVVSTALNRLPCSLNCLPVSTVCLSQLPLTNTRADSAHSAHQTNMPGARFSDMPLLAMSQWECNGSGGGIA